MKKNNSYFDEYRNCAREFLEIAKVRKGFTWRQYAEATGQSFQNVYNKLDRGSITMAELFLFADKFGLEVHLIDKETGKIIS